jgi:class 3 adenylate cyclase/ABC-type lipoprotein export system ATPase subunit
VSELKRWLQELGLEKYEAALRAQDIDLEVVPELTELDLEKIGFSLGHRRKFITAAAHLRMAAGGPARPQEATAPDERRQVTVLFSDIVASSALAAELDPEDLRRLLGEYRAACAGAIERYEGHVAQYLGDGVLAYFGYPRALEDAAERALRAGLDIVAHVARVKRPDGRPLEARVGIATGLVASGGAGAKGEATVVGDTPNLAARLQALAEPGTVLVSPSTHRLTGDLFEYLFVGEHELKGFPDPVRAWRVLGASVAESRFFAAHAAAAAPIVGRERELAFLDDAWQRAARGNGHVVLVSGEAGMGKSRLLEALAERVRDQPHRLLRAQCSPYHRSSVLYPFTQLLRQRLDLRRELSAAENLERIDRALARFGRATRQARLLLAEQLDLAAPESLSPAELTPAQRKEATLDILEAFLLTPVDGATVLLLLEDAHWSDPSTLLLMERILARVDREQALVVVSHRPDFRAAWADRPQATTLRCKPLGAEHSAALARHVASRHGIDDALVREITSRSDGVPLFVEELTKAVLELPAARSEAVPHSLQDSLMARLDRLGGAKEIAQAASAIGRQFPRTLLSAVAGTDETTLAAGLERLRNAGLVVAAGMDKDASYSFNHALVQEAAYESLSRARRQALHARIARALEADGVESDSAVIADHYARARDPQKACDFWMLAAERAGQRLALAEAVTALNAALAQAGRVADPTLRARLELAAQLELGATVALLKGPTSGEAEQVLLEAHRLAGKLKAGPELFQASWGLYINAARNRRYDRAAVIGQELTAIADGLGDPDLQYEALHHRWGYAYFTGDALGTLRLTEEGIRRYDRARHHRFAYVYAGHDACVCAHCVKAIALGEMGEARAIAPAMQAALALSAELEHPATLVFAQIAGCAALSFGRDADALEAFAARTVETAARYDVPVNREIGAFWTGAARVMRGETESGMATMAASFETTLASGFIGVLPGVAMVEALMRGNRAAEALALVARLLEATETPEVGMFMSELWRLRGELAERDDPALAEGSLRTAFRIATTQRAALLHARAGLSLARWLGRQRRLEEADQVLTASGASGLPDRDAPEVAAATAMRTEWGGVSP